MKFSRQAIPDIVLIEPFKHSDDRGYFIESYRQDLFEDFIGYKVNFVQDNESKSVKGVLRGLHYQTPPYAQAKLVTVLEGSVLDIAVDIRKSSPFFAQHVAVELNQDNKHQLFIPHGFAHGFVVLSKTAIFSYKSDNFYAPNYEKGIAFDDNQLSIDWRLPIKEVLLSEKDKLQPKFSNTKDYFD